MGGRALSVSHFVEVTCVVCELDAKCFGLCMNKGSLCRWETVETSGDKFTYKYDPAEVGQLTWGRKQVNLSHLNTAAFSAQFPIILLTTKDSFHYEYQVRLISLMPLFKGFLLTSNLIIWQHFEQDLYDTKQSKCFKVQSQERKLRINVKKKN